MSQYQKGKTNMDFTEARDSEWQWHQLGHMQPHTVCKSAPRSRLISMPAPDHAVFYMLDALPATQPTALKHCILAVKRLLCQLFFLDRCNDLESAGTAFKALHGWWFDGRLVTVKYLREQRYEERYLDSHCANSAILPSNNSRLSLSQPFHSSVIENS